MVITLFYENGFRWQVPRIEIISSKSAILVPDMLYVF